MARHILRRRLARLQKHTPLYDETDIASLIRRARTQSYAAGQVILPKGSRGDCLGLVTQGRVAARAGAAHQERSPSLLGPGSIFGESMWLGGRPSPHTYQALTDARVRFLRRQDLLDVAQQRQARLAVPDGSRVRWVAGAVALAMVLCVLWAVPGVRKAAALGPYSAGLWMGSHGCVRGAEAAFSWASVVLASAADWPALQQARGNLYLAGGRVDQAERAFTRALALDTAAAEALNGLGLVYAARGDHAAAIGFFERALEIEPGQSTVLANLAQSLQRAGNTQAALRAYALAHSIDAPNSVTLVNEAIVYYASADLDAAEAAAHAALAMDPSLAPAHTVLAAVRLSEGRLGDAWTHLSQARHLDPGYAPAHFLSGLIAKSRDMRQLAIDAFERVLLTSNDPTTLQQARLHLDELYADR